jgi:hypothetical protein
MTCPRPLANRFLRRSLITTGACGAVAVWLNVWTALVTRSAVSWLDLLVIALAWSVAVWNTLVGFRLGWSTRVMQESERTAGGWMMFPVDADGVPTTAPVTGRLVIDRPGED